MVNISRGSFNALDGHPLTYQLFEPEGSEGGAGIADQGSSQGGGQGGVAVVLHPATGVNLHLYRKFAEYIVETHGWPVLTYDLRGSGESAQPGDERNRNMRMSDWILLDVPAALDFLGELFPGRMKVAIGHSVGAHGMFATQAEHPADVMVQIAAHAGITKLISTRAEQLRIGAIFNVLTPIFSRVLGYVPVERLGVGKSIPVGVMLQWARWTRDPRYFFGDAEFDLQERFAAARGRLLSVVFSDDLWANRRASDVLTDELVNVDVVKRDIVAGAPIDASGGAAPGGAASGDAAPGDAAPGGVGERRNPRQIGHMGFYRSANAVLWPQVMEWVAAEVARVK